MFLDKIRKLISLSYLKRFSALFAYGLSGKFISEFQFSFCLCSLAKVSLGVAVQHGTQPDKKRVCEFLNPLNRRKSVAG